MVNWAEVGAVAAILALVEVPAIAAVVAGYRWVKDVNARLERIEARSHQRRASDPPHP
jgi:hypothetical protein